MNRYSAEGYKSMSSGLGEMEGRKEVFNLVFLLWKYTFSICCMLISLLFRMVMKEIV